MNNKPSWSDAPEWANWLAMDDDGEWFWYQFEPKWHHSYWAVYIGKTQPAFVLHNNTLEKRP